MEAVFRVSENSRCNVTRHMMLENVQENVQLVTQPVSFRSSDLVILTVAPLPYA